MKTGNKSNNLKKLFYLINYIGFSFLTSEIYFITGRNILICNLSPTILFQAFSLVMIFYSIKITNKYLIKIIKFITPSIFSATLLHLMIFRLKTLKVLHLFESIRKLNSEFHFVKIYIVSILVFIFCIILDFFRLLLFKIFKIREICLFIERIFPKIFDKFGLIN